MSSNLPEGKIAVLMTPEQLDLIIQNAEKNEEFAMRQLLAWSQLDADALAAMRESFLKLDSLKDQFRQLKVDMKAQRDG